MSGRRVGRSAPSGGASEGKTEDTARQELGGPDGITLESLRKLQAFFGASKALNERQFVEKLGGVLGRNLSKQKLTHLFMKIDVNSDGTVDWDEFTNFMFLDKKESLATQLDLDSENAYRFEPVAPSVMEDANRAKLRGRQPHRDVIRALIPLPDQGRFLSCSRDGTICFWNAATFQLLRHLQTIQAPNVFRHGINTLGADYLTAATYMSYSNRLAVASVDNSVSFYDIHGSERELVGRIPSVELRQAAPLCLGYNFDRSNMRERLVIGDDSGGISLYNLKPGWHICDGTMPCHSKLDVFPRVKEEGLANKLREGPTSHRRALKELAHPLQPVRFLPNTQCGHADHVVQADIVTDLNSIVTASLDTTCNVIDLERGILKRKFKNHRKPVYSFAWCGHNKILASCGLERDIIMWSPYSERAVATLSGHLSAVRKVIVNDKDNQLISLGADNVVKVWDIRNQRCIQTLTDARTMEKATTANSLNLLMYDKETQRLFGASSHIRAWDTVPMFKSTRVSSHDSSVVSALYNRGFNQVVSADVENHVVVWDVDTGTVASQFEIDSPGNALTAMAFDNGGRRLVTGTHEGDRCLLFNFSNGCLLTQLVKHQPDESDGDDDDQDGAPAGPASPAQPATTTSGGRSPQKSPWPGTYSALTIKRVKPRVVDPRAVLATSPTRRAKRPANDVAFGSRIHDNMFDFGLPRRAGGKRAADRTSRTSPSAVMPTPGSGRGKPSHRRRRRGRGTTPALDAAMRDELPKGKPRTRLGTPAVPALLAKLQSDAQRTGRGAGAGASGAPRLSATLLTQQLGDVAKGHRRHDRGSVASTVVGPPTPSPLRGAGQSSVYGFPGGSTKSIPAANVAIPDTLLATQRSTILPTAAQLQRRPVTDSVAEVTAIEYCVHELPRMRGQASIQNRFIISVGWDRRAYVWQDNGDFGKHHGYLMRFPEDPSTGHKDDILCVSFCPPSVVATGGYDGHFILWSINSAGILANFDLEAPVECTTHIKKLDLACVCTARGFIYFVDCHECVITYEVDAMHPVGAAVQAMYTDNANDHLFTGDSDGFVKVWEMGNDALAGPPLRPFAMWKAHSKAVTSVNYIEQATMMETFCVSASAGGDIIVWTLAGVKVGMFGQDKPWQLGDPSTWAATEPAGMPDDVRLRRRQRSGSVVSDTSRASMRSRARRERRNSAASSFAGEFSGNAQELPSVGDVWYRVSDVGVHEDVMTITRIDDEQDIVEGYDGLAHHTQGDLLRGWPVRRMAYKRFLKDVSWTRHTEMTACIGRIFVGSVASKPFKVLFARVVGGRWRAVDVLMREHDPPKIPTRTPATRSLSVFASREGDTANAASAALLRASKQSKAQPARGRKGRHGRRGSDHKTTAFKIGTVGGGISAPVDGDDALAAFAAGAMGAASGAGTNRRGRKRGSSGGGTTATSGHTSRPPSPTGSRRVTRRRMSSVMSAAAHGDLVVNGNDAMSRFVQMMAAEEAAGQLQVEGASAPASMMSSEHEEDEVLDYDHAFHISKGTRRISHVIRLSEARAAAAAVGTLAADSNDSSGSGSGSDAGSSSSSALGAGFRAPPAPMDTLTRERDFHTLSSSQPRAPSASLPLLSTARSPTTSPKRRKASPMHRSTPALAQRRGMPSSRSSGSVSLAAIKAINTSALLRVTNQVQRVIREPKDYSRPLFNITSVPGNMRDMKDYISGLRHASDDESG